MRIAEYRPGSVGITDAGVEQGVVAHVACEIDGVPSTVLVPIRQVVWDIAKRADVEAFCLEWAERIVAQGTRRDAAARPVVMTRDDLRTALGED